jgi:hypothetical protein
LNLYCPIRVHPWLKFFSAVSNKAGSQSNVPRA